MLLSAVPDTSTGKMRILRTGEWRYGCTGWRSDRAYLWQLGIVGK